MNQYRLLINVSWTQIKSRFKQAMIATFGVMFGISTFIVLMSFMTGLNKLLDGLIINRTPHIQIYNEIKPSEKQPLQDYLSNTKNTLINISSIKPMQTLPNIRNANKLISYLNKQDQVRGVSKQVRVNAFYIAGTNELTGMLLGIDAKLESELFNFDDYLIEGKPDQLNKTQNGVLIGAGIAKKMSLHTNDRIFVRSVQGIQKGLKIVGIYQSGLAEVDDVQSYVNIKTGQQLLGKYSHYYTNINIKLDDLTQAPTYAKIIQKLFNVSALDIQSANAQFDTGSTIRNLITYAVSFTLLLVAGFGIYNVLNMLIYEKMNEIAILKATGFTAKDVYIIFISQALLIGVMGGLLGLSIGYLLSLWINKIPFDTEALPTIETYPINFDPLFYISGVAFAILATFLAGYLPARKASKLDPVEIIRSY